MTMNLKPDGRMEWIDGEPFIPVVNVRKHRLSHITPAFHPIKTPLFKLLRRLFGDEGRVAAWTRRWRCLWFVKMVRCGEWSVFRDRSNAVHWERQHLNHCEVCNGTFDNN